MVLLGTNLGDDMSGMLMAGSQKGSALLAEIRRKYPNYHPVLAIVDIAHDEKSSLELQFNCHKTVAKYIEPELKSIEVKGDFKTQQSVTVSLFSDPEPTTVEFSESGFKASDTDVNVALMTYNGG